MRFIPLGSGSQGNATLVEMAGTRVLVDAGLSASALARRLEAVGVAPGEVACLLLTHEHEDHARGAARFSTRHGVPAACSWQTLEALDCSPSHFAEWIALDDEGPLDLGALRVEPFPVPHDAARPVGFVLHGEGLAVGVATDLGHVTPLVRERLRACHVLLLETNHDDELLQHGPYPWSLKQRVAGRFGHLSNDEAGAALVELAGPDCRAVVLGHLSEQNNTPALARRACATALGRAGRPGLAIRVAAARRPTPAIEL